MDLIFIANLSFIQNKHTILTNKMNHESEK